MRMRRFRLPWLVALLCLATLFNGVSALAASAAVPQGHPPCEMGAGHAPDSPCGDCGDSNALCAQQCAAMGAGGLVAEPAFTLMSRAPSERVDVSTAALFDSHAGPPGFQPPR